MRITTQEPMVPNEDGTPLNPFNQDGFNMGSYLGTNVAVMYGQHDNRCQEYIIVIDRLTGERVYIDFGEHPREWTEELGWHCPLHTTLVQQHKTKGNS